MTDKIPAMTELPELPRCDYPNMQYQRRYVGNLYTADQMRAYALAALRPQAVPMTRAQRLEVFRKAEDRMAHDINLCWREALIEETEAHHGITQRADVAGGGAPINRNVERFGEM